MRKSDGPPLKKLSLAPSTANLKTDNVEPIVRESKDARSLSTAVDPLTDLKPMRQGKLDSGDLVKEGNTNSMVLDFNFDNSKTAFMLFRPHK